MYMVKRPFDLLNVAVGKKVVIGLKGGKEFKGKMLAFDVHMNVVLENAETKNGEESITYKTIFIRGDSLVYLSPLEE